MDRPASQKRPTGHPIAPFKWQRGRFHADNPITYIVSGAHRGKRGQIRKWGLAAWARGEEMIYDVKVSSNENVVVWAADTTITKPGMVVYGGVWWCMVVYGGASLC